MKIRIRRLALLFVLPNVAFLAIVSLIAGDLLIKFLNGIMVALSVGVCVAYFPVTREVLLDRHRSIDRADILALGIFCGWFAIAGRAIWSILWHYNGRPFEWPDGAGMAYLLYLGTWAAGFHLLAPGAIGHRIPSRDWVKVGALCAVGVLSIFVASWLLNAFPLSAG